MFTLSIDLDFSYLPISNPFSASQSTPMTRTLSSRRPRVLILGRNLADKTAVEELERVADVYYLLPVPEDKVRQAIADKVESDGPFDAVTALFSSDPFPWKFGPEQFASLAPHTKLYVRPGAGFDSVDVDWITSTGAYFANCPEEVGVRTADGALSLILTIARGLNTQYLSARAGNWRDPSVKALNWRGKTLGIFGLGNIGTQVANSASALGFKIIYNNRSAVRGSRYEWVSKKDLLKRADIILVLVPLTEATRHFIDEKAFAQAKDGVILVNVARGPVVNEQHLVDALESGKVLRAALDVFEREPEIHPKLRENKNVYVTPHVLAATEDISEVSANEALRNIVQFFKTGRPNTPINEPKGH